jgi:hypothetical protein
MLKGEAGGVIVGVGARARCEQSPPFRVSMSVSRFA